ncbi:EmrB/QacA subfamily drug resistance transporter [Salinibacterium amurskyense]|uniref:EmrB/QacA subfamily drug resistance transporter n=1 Tax=Salinibacterium amurskyense TaxID=205941 RepID=A0A2M9DAI1_9MICO|nr:MFS transporter [Salinibacterium amurskyense]PJJ82608.1 EmrB/QacA subfamily drug resistance transporter [Salinibacterium amurskyense]RLQ82333.1 MFS transporter [Salinibacterium amurskyense]GHD76341.1 MFS transporter [Salinibacterium amurskyense]
MTSTPATDEATASPLIEDPRRRRAILWAVCIALMAVVASVSGLNVAQPQLATTFDASQGQVLWMINTYTLTLAALLLPLGAAGDRLGRKPVLIVGLIVFGIANISAAVAPIVEVMLAARLLSGIGAAMIMPVTLSVITSSFPDKERSRAIGLWTAVAGGGGILGMYLSALLVDAASWRWLFALPIVLTVAAVLIGVRAVPNSRELAPGRFDLLGTLTSIIATVGFTFALHEAPGLGWTAPIVLATLAAALIATVGFVAWELRTPFPLLDLRHFRTRGLSSGTTLLLVLFGVQGGVSLVLYPFFQVVLGWSGLLATLGLMPMALLMMLASGLAPRLAARIGARAAMVGGLSITTIGLALMAALVSISGGYLSVLPGLIAMGLGAGLAMTPSTEAITSSLPREQQGVASALNDLTRELGSALGIALLGGLLVAGYQNTISARLDGVPEELAATASEGIANASAVSHDAGEYAEQILVAAQEAFVAGWQQAMWVGVAVMTVLMLFVLVRGPKTAPAEIEVSP